MPWSNHSWTSGDFGGDGEVGAADSLHVPGPLAEAAVEGGAVGGVAGLVISRGEGEE